MLELSCPDMLALKDATPALIPGAPSLEFKAEGADKVEGYGAVFGNVDQGWDVIEPGAFADSLKSDRKVRFLWQHSPWDVIGTWDDLSEDDKGLRVRGRLLGDVQRGKEAMSLLKAGAIDGLSIGYRAVEWRESKLESGNWVRIIEKADLFEVSLVTFPMNPAATLDAKSAAAMSRTEIERHLLSHSGMSRTVVGALMRGGYEGVKALSRSGDADPADPALRQSGAKSASELAEALRALIAGKQAIVNR